MTPDATALRGARVLITGGLGFIGSTLARRLVDLSARVTVLDSLIPEYGGNLFNLEGYEERVRVNIGDMRDEHGIRHLVQGQDFIFNLAGQVSHLDSMRDPFTDLEINCRSQLFLLEACRARNPSVRLVNTSTRQVYGRPIKLPVDEEHPLSPVDINGVHKLASDWYAHLYHHAYGLRATSLRLTNTYGERMRVKDARQTFLGLWLRQLLEGSCIEVFGDGSQKRDFNHVDDVVEALLATALCRETEGGVYNLGSREVVSLRDLARLLVEINGGGAYRLIPFPEDRQRIDIGSFYAASDKLRRVLGWTPKVSLREGLARALEYFRAHLDRYR